MGDLILGVDPGGTTGVVVFDPETLMIVEFEQLSADTDEWAPWFQRVVPTVSVVAAERFVITTRTATLTRQYDALDVLGALRYLCAIERRRLILQMPGDAKVAFPNEFLVQMSYYKQVTGKHARDALRHALLATRRLHQAI